jgi:hypothetical protein
MKDAMKQEPLPVVTTEEVLGEFGFRLTWSALPHWAGVTAHEIVAREADTGAPCFGQCNSISTTVEGVEPYLNGSVKWDGCTELDMGCPHWCGPDGYAKHILLLQHIYRRAFELMGREPEEDWALTITEIE